VNQGAALPTNARNDSIAQSVVDGARGEAVHQLAVDVNDWHPAMLEVDGALFVGQLYRWASVLLDVLVRERKLARGQVSAGATVDAAPARSIEDDLVAPCRGSWRLGWLGTRVLRSLDDVAAKLLRASVARMSLGPDSCVLALPAPHR